MATVLVYSSNAAVRERVRTAIGRRPAEDLGPLTWVECDNAPEAVATVDAGGIDVAVFDGEAWPTGGMGLCRQLKNEVADCPLVLLLVARADDRWLAVWSQADRWVSHPIDPFEISSAVVDLLRQAGTRVPAPAGARGLRARFRRG
jgi:DNA-binding response OmpR family regulator